MAMTKAEMDAYRNKIATMAQTLQAMRKEAKEIEELWFDLSISSDAEYTVLTSAEQTAITNMITHAQHFQAFYDNAAVGTADRSPHISPWLLRQT